ncbi:hypothetical protein H072_10471 [Dactylellina haptotyla CBS 200.50]|uniref:Uncharacterized protein n=1 Tax=Dactylellina haptotyla (strain CBS 200.50) TaxID=1284197 RepID=S7ZZZ8_DACHA|nr:hypothetical protein H072_10471 [Dactylellina haptotyla CBS 200.50]
MPYKFDSVNSGNTIKFFKVDPNNGNLLEQSNFNPAAGFGNGMPTSPINAVALPAAGGSFDRYHVFYLSSGSSSSQGILQERYWTPSTGWQTGSVGGLNFAVQATSTISSAMWMDGSTLNIRIYVTNTAGNIAEIGLGNNPSGWVLIRTVG